MVSFKNFTYLSKSVGDSDFTGASVEELIIDGGYLFSRRGGNSKAVTEISMPLGMPDVCLFTITEILMFIKKSNANIKIDVFEESETELKITGKINLNKFTGY